MELLVKIVVDEDMLPEHLADAIMDGHLGKLAVKEFKVTSKTDSYSHEVEVK